MVLNPKVIIYNSLRNMILYIKLAHFDIIYCGVFVNKELYFGM